MGKQIQKPMSILKDEFIGNIVGLINSSGLPLIVVEYILKDMLAQVAAMNAKQYQADKQNYEKMKETEKEKNEPKE